MDAAVIHFQLGPYHLARGRALRALRPCALVQLAAAERLREWRVDGLPDWVHTIAEGALEDLRPRRVAARTAAWLEAHRPAAVCIAGYSHAAMRAAAAWARSAGRPVVLLTDSQRVDRPRWRLKEALKRLWIGRRVDAAFVSGSRAAEYAVSLGVRPDRVWRGYDVVDNDAFAAQADAARADAAGLRRRLGLPARFLLFVGRLSPEKNLPRLLEAFAAVRADWGLVLAGGGPLEAELRAAARARGLEGRVRFAGFLQQDALCELYALADALVLPSTSETWGLIVNEAMACGLPVLASIRCGCVPELVHPGVNGQVFDPTSTADLVAALERVAFAGPAEREAMGRASRELIGAFTPATWARALDDCLRAVGVPGGGAP